MLADKLNQVKVCLMVTSKKKNDFMKARLNCISVFF
jgi:hypothetical protein